MKKPKQDHALAVVKAGLSSVPVIGGSLASLVGDYIPSATQKTIEEALEDLASKLDSLANRVDVEAVNKDEFSELFKSSYLLIQRSHRKEKVEAAVNLMVNILLKPGDPEKLSYTELDHFARCLDLLSIGALQVLRVILKVNLDAEAKGKEFQEASQLTVRGLNSRLPNLDMSLLIGLLRELSALHLIDLPTIRSRDMGDQPINLTRLGVRFLKHVLGLA